MRVQLKYSGKEIDELLGKVAEGKFDETDPIFSKSPAASITEEKKAEWNNKVDKVNGKQLSTEDFTTTLKNKLEGLVNYDDTELSNALTTLRGDLDRLVSGDTTSAIKTFNEIIAFLDGVQDTQDLASIIASIEQQIAGKMDRPSGGIPKNALASEVQTSLSKADTALQSVPSDFINSLNGKASIEQVQTMITEAITNTLNTEV